MRYPTLRIIFSAGMAIFAAFPAFSQESDSTPAHTAVPDAIAAPARNITVDPGLASLSVPHLQVCQQGFEALFGVPQGVDPDEVLIIRGATQSYYEDPRFGDNFKSALEIAMPYERVLPPGPPSGAVILGRIVCAFEEHKDATSASSFPLTPTYVTIEEEGVTRRLSPSERMLFRP